MPIRGLFVRVSAAAASSVYLCLVLPVFALNFITFIYSLYARVLGVCACACVFVHVCVGDVLDRKRLEVFWSAQINLLLVCEVRRVYV